MSLEFVPVAQGQYGTYPEEVVGAFLIQNAEEAAAASVKADVITATDFDTQFLVYVAAGSKPTGGYAVTIKNVEEVGGSVVVSAHLQTPKNQFSTMAFTRPYSVAKVNKGSTSSFASREATVNWV